MSQFHSLPIADITQETPDTVTLHFDIPAALKEEFLYKAGQYLTLKFHIHGEEVRRSYSMSSTPHHKHVSVSVKRVKNGLVSNYIHDHIKKGDTIAVMPPQGRFIAVTNPERKCDYYLFGAGSGITPLMSIAQTIIEEEPLSVVYLLYGNRKEEDIIFHSQLLKLQQSYQGQIQVRFVLSKPPVEKVGGVFGIFKKASTSWEGATGRIDYQQISKFFEDFPSKNKEKKAYICGPGEFLDNTELTIQDMGFDKKSIYTERFTTAIPSESNNVVGKEGAVVSITLLQETFELTVPSGKTILDALLDDKRNPPYSCSSGSCSTCMAKVTSGEVKMEVCYALDEDEVLEGYILTCQAHPTTAKVSVNFDI